MKTKTLDDSTQADIPGALRLSVAKMSRFHPGIYREYGLFGLKFSTPRQWFWRTRFQEHLLHGAIHAALVMTVKPLIIAAYNEDIDCVVLLKMPAWLEKEHDLKAGTRLLTVNLYGRGGNVARDLVEGPKSTGVWKNYTPFIADFLTDDIDRLAEAKSIISEDEWKRTMEMAEKRLEVKKPRLRDGRPLFAGNPA